MLILRFGFTVGEFGRARFSGGLVGCGFGEFVVAGAFDGLFCWVLVTVVLRWIWCSSKILGLWVVWAVEFGFVCWRDTTFLRLRM